MEVKIVNVNEIPQVRSSLSPDMMNMILTKLESLEASQAISFDFPTKKEAEKMANSLRQSKVLKPKISLKLRNNSIYITKKLEVKKEVKNNGKSKDTKAN